MGEPAIGASEPKPVHTELTNGGIVYIEADNRSLILFDSGDEVTIQAGDMEHPSATLRKLDTSG